MTERQQLLVVDDDDDLRETLQLILEMEGFEVVTAANGLEALDLLRDGPLPDLVLLDLRMPVMDGWQTIDALRAEALLQGLHVVICTSAPQDAPPGFPLLNKPVDLAQLTDVLRRVAKAPRLG